MPGADSQWTVETLKHHLESVINQNENLSVQRHNSEHNAVSIALEAQKELTIQAQAAATEAVRKAEAAVEKRFDSVNEFRAQLGDQARTFVPRSEFDVRLDPIIERISKLENRSIGLDGRKTGLGEGWGWAVGIAGFVVMVVSLITTIAVLMRPK